MDRLNTTATAPVAMFADALEASFLSIWPHIESRRGLTEQARDSQEKPQFT